MIKNKTIVITGASSGIGFEVMKRFASESSNTILAVARRTEKLEGFAPNVIPFSCDVSSCEGIDKLFDKMSQLFDCVDIFYANAGVPYYEKFDYENWDRVKAIFDLNTISPIYTYSRYINYLKGRKGQLVYTISAIGEMAMPGFALYSASKFGLNGFQQAIRLEKPENLTLTCIYPVSTKTNFAKVAGEGEEVDLPAPVQDVEEVADAAVKGIEEGKESIYPCKVYLPSKVIMSIFPFARKAYWNQENAKFLRHLERQKK